MADNFMTNYWIYLLAAKLCNESYASTENLSANLQYFFRQQFKNVVPTARRVSGVQMKTRIHENEDFRMIELRYGEDLYLAIRGSVTNMNRCALLNWMKNLDLTTRPFGSTTVHAGFYAHFDKGRSSIEHAIKSWPTNQVRRIIFCGHSLGGAVAQLSYYYFTRMKPELFATTEIGGDSSRTFECITFGSPRTGCADFARDFRRAADSSSITKLGRFVRANPDNLLDLVSSVPDNNVASGLGNYGLRDFLTNMSFGESITRTMAGVVTGTERYEHPYDMQKLKTTVDGRITITGSNEWQTLMHSTWAAVKELHSHEDYFNLLFEYIQIQIV